jgi:spoIIIJ-associated protein
LEKLSLSEEEVNFEVIKKGKSGFLGMGGEEAIVRVSPRQPLTVGGELLEKARETLENLLGLMKLKAAVEVEPARDKPKEITLNIKGDNLGILIGRRGQTLTHLQYIVKAILSHQYQANVKLNVDVNGYQQQHYRSLEGLALRVAQNVKATGKAITLEPMSAKERRLIHLAIAKEPELTSRSIGEGEIRQVIISLRRKGKS